MKLIFISALLVLLYLRPAAQPGALDLSFGDSGKIISNTYEGSAYTSLQQPDGKIIIGGSGGYYVKNDAIGGSFLVRYNTDGTPDFNFGDSGRAVYNLGKPVLTSGNIYAISLQKDGRIVAAFYGSNSFAVMRINTDGTVDKSFGEGGLAVGNEDHGYLASDMAMLPDGRIVITGDLYDDINDDSRSFIACFTADGKLDNSFGDKGVMIITFDDATDVNAIAVTSEGKIIIGGNYHFTNKIFLLRYNTDGSEDKSFGMNGSASMLFSSNVDIPVLKDMVIAEDNTIVTAGWATYNSRNEVIVTTRFLKNGATDSSFGTNGYTLAQYEKGDARANAVAVQQNGKVVATGRLLRGETAVYTTVRYTKDGWIDSSFAKNGILNTTFYNQDASQSVLIQKDGKILLSGSSVILSKDKLVTTLARYNGDEQGKQPLMVRIKRWLLHHGISWQVQQSKDVRYYAIQRSADGIVYKEIAKLSNKTQVDKYEDAASITGSSYYRLAAIGWDGARTYSNTILIDDNAQVKVFPNPVRDNLQLQGLSEGKTSVSIVDLQGNVRSSSVAGGASYSINTSQLTPGNYLLKLQHNSTTTTQPFVKE